MSNSQILITIAICILATVITRFTPFLIFNENKKTPEFITYIGKYLPASIFGMLVVYCLRSTEILGGSHGIPELISIVFTIIIHLYKRQMLISIAGGTFCYMLLVNFLFS